MDAPERSTHLVITSAPNDKPLQLVSEEDRPLTVFRAQVAPSGHLVSMEVLSAAGIGRRREFVEPLPMEGPGLSDLLLFRPRGVIDPTARDEAVGMMLGSAVSRDLGLVGLYWEEYGLPASDSLALELAIRKEDSGALAHLARVVGIGGVEGSGVISWIHLGEGGPPSRTMTLDLSRIDAGRYEVVLRVTGEHGLALESKQTLELIG